MMAWAIEVLIIVLALWFAPSMVYKAVTKRELSDDVPISDWLRAAWPDIRYRAAVAWWWLWRVLAPAERRPYPEYAVMASDDDEEAPNSSIVAPVATPQPTQQFAVATPQNDNNDVIVIAALARLVAAGEVSQTAAIKVGLGVAPSSTSTRYAAVRTALREEVERIKGDGKPEFNLTEEQIAWRRSIGLE